MKRFLRKMNSVVSLFAGIGGICLGFKQANFDIIWANEKDHAACLTYRHNFGSEYLAEGDVRKIPEACIPHADILAAGFPCQSFSAAGAGRGFSDPRGTLFFEVIRVAKAIQPRVIFLENVESLMEHHNGRTFQTIYCPWWNSDILSVIKQWLPMSTQTFLKHAVEYTL